jgi:hypothetical protein
MNVCWVIADNMITDPIINIKDLKSIGSLWGSWRTWRTFETDNILCHDATKAHDLIKRNITQFCNFYISKNIYSELDNPAGVKLYAGDFVHDVDNQEEIIAMHLASSINDIVLLLGFDFSKRTKNSDPLAEHRTNNYYNLIRQAILDNDKTQWVAVDHPKEFSKEFNKIENLTQDSFESVLGLLKG